MTQNNASYPKKMYYAHFCASAFVRAVDAYTDKQPGKGSGAMLTDSQFGQYLTLAAYECCGDTGFPGAVATVLALAADRSPKAHTAALKYLERFATLDHITTLENSAE